MSKSKIKKVIKAAKPTKTRPIFKKERPQKAEKNIKNKKVAKPMKKAMSNNATKKIVKKKSIIKKAAKPIKKAIAKKTTSKKLIKSAKKVETKKTTLLLVSPLENKKNKTGKKSSNVKIVSKQNKVNKEEKAIKNSPSKIITVASEKIVKNEEFKKMKDKPNKSKRGRKPKGSDDDEPEIVHDELVEQLIRSTKKLRSQPKKPKIIRTFTNPRASLSAVLPDANKKSLTHPKKEPKGKFELEYVAHTSPGILFEFLTTPSGLSEWFADDVNIQDGIFTFFWDGSEQKAKLLSFREEKYVRFQWFDKPDGTYFEFRIERDELTGDISLLIVDFADEATEMKTSKLLWDSQVSKLLHVIGSY